MILRGYINPFFDYVCEIELCEVGKIGEFIVFHLRNAIPVREVLSCMLFSGVPSKKLC